ncbi:MAG: hypothetical protein CL666_01305 [Balneola sp.]|nr:hypothetical protein [Balneola sp.]|tara:strand:- start:66 stop:1787 length:1722 start_codon:yes stop_codon:yes gene_type:complete
MKTTSNSNIRIMKSSIVILMIAMSTTVLAQGNEQQGNTISIELTVPEYVLQDGETVAIRGEFPGGTASKGVALEKTEGERWTGSITAPSNRGQSFEYEYIILRTDGSTYIEWYDGRSFDLSSGQPLEINDFFRGLGPVLEEPVQLSITVDLSGLDNPEYQIQNVGLMGSHGGLSWEFPGRIHELENIQGESSSWTTTLELPMGTPIDFPMKFTWKVDDIWNWEFLPHYQLHLLLFDSEANEYKVDFAFDSQGYQLKPSQAEGLDANNYAKAAELFKGGRNYHYHLAMSLLDRDDPAGAQLAFDQYHEYFPEESETTYEHFNTAKIQHLAVNGMHNRALEMVEKDFNDADSGIRKSYHRYLKGWVFMAIDSLKASREAMKKAIILADDEKDEYSKKQYARFGLAMGYLKETDPSLKEQAKELLVEFSTKHSNEKIRRQGWKQLAAVTSNTPVDTLHKRALQELRELGSPRQKAKAKVRWAQYRLEYASPDEADSVWTEFIELEEKLTDLDLLDELQVLKAEYLLQRQRAEEARGLLEKVAGAEGRQNAAKHKARYLLQRQAKEQHEKIKEEEKQ